MAWTLVSWTFRSHQSNVWENGTFYNSLDNYYFNGSEDEPIDEVTAWGKKEDAIRRLNIGLSMEIDYIALDMFMDFRNQECTAIQNIDPEHTCQPGQQDNCQTFTVNVPSITSSQAQAMNSDYQDMRTSETMGIGLGVSSATALIGGAVNPVTGVSIAYAVIAGTYVSTLPGRDSSEPIQAGDSFVIKTTACPGGYGQTPHVTTDVEYFGSGG